MSNKKSTYKVLEEIINSFVYEIKVKQIVDLLDGTFKIFTCNTLYLTENKVITIGVNDYLIKELVCNEYFIVSGPVLPVAEIITLPPPFFFHGTVIATNEELTEIQFSEDKTPFIYLLETLREKYPNDSESAVLFEANIRLCFLTEANFEDWNTQAHHEKAIAPMRNLAFYLLENNDNFGEFTLIDRAKFGVYISEKGSQKQLFNDNLSGVESEINFIVYKNQACLDC